MRTLLSHEKKLSAVTGVLLASNDRLSSSDSDGEGDNACQQKPLTRPPSQLFNGMSLHTDKLYEKVVKVWRVEDGQFL